MDVIKYSIAIVEDISDEQYAQIVGGFKKYFIKKGLRVKSSKKYSGSTEIVFFLDLLAKPEVLNIIGVNIGFSFIMTFAGPIIKEISNKIKGKNILKYKNKRDYEIFALTIQEISLKPELAHEYASHISIEKCVREATGIVKNSGCNATQINITRKTYKEKLNISYELKKHQYKNKYDFSFNIGLKTSFKKDEITMLADTLDKILEMQRAVVEGSNREFTASILQSKIETGDFDVFLCYNSEDKLLVKEIGERLKERGILPWMDVWELRPGIPWQKTLEEQIAKIKSAAVFIGKKGIGPWQDIEQDAFIRQFVKRKCIVIPVILPNCTKTPKLPIILEGMQWVDFRKEDPDPITQLIYGITGKRLAAGHFIKNKNK